MEEYTSYEFSRKIEKKVKLFSEKEIGEGKLDIQDPQLLELLVNWCEELERNFEMKAVFEREEPFYMLDGKKQFVENEELERLATILDAEKEKIRRLKAELLGNNYEQEKLLSMDNFHKAFGYLPEAESRVGFFSAVQFKNMKYYVITYLNALIHGLLTARAKYFGSFKHRKSE